MMRKLLLFLLPLLISSQLTASTWDEPWREEILKASDALVRGTVTKKHGTNHVTLDVKKTLAGEEITGKVKIKGYFLLNLKSTSAGSGPSLPFEKGKEYYVLLKKKTDDVYRISTPTSGFDTVKKGKVIATYRHSFHQSRVPVSIYETTMTALFQGYHDQQVEQKAVRSLVDKWLSREPVTLTNKKKVDLFFKQHAALETVYHLRLDGYSSKLIHFFNQESFHSRVSAARAMVTCDQKKCKTLLIDALEKSGYRDFTKVVIVRTLSKLNTKPFRDRLEKIAKNASTEAVQFNANLMDPRVATVLPSVKQALNKMLKKSDQNEDQK